MECLKCKSKFNLKDQLLQTMEGDDSAFTLISLSEYCKFKLMKYSFPMTTKDLVSWLNDNEKEFNPLGIYSDIRNMIDILKNDHSDSLESIENKYKQEVIGSLGMASRYLHLYLGKKGLWKDS